MPHRPIVRSLGRLILSAALALGLSYPLASAVSAQEAAAGPPPAEARPAPQLPSPQCRRYRAELASLQSGASTTRALNDEIGRLEAYFRGLNCEGGKFLFFDTRPPQCGAVEQRIRALKATYGGAVIDDSGARKRELQGSWPPPARRARPMPAPARPMAGAARRWSACAPVTAVSSL